MGERDREASELHRQRWLQPKSTKPLPPHLDERLERHRLEAEPWLKRVEENQRGWDSFMEASRNAHEYYGEHREAAYNDFENTAAEILGDLRQEPDELRVSVAIAWLYLELNDSLPSRIPPCWVELNRRALAYEAADLELMLDLIAGVEIGWVFAPALVRAIERFVAKSGSLPDACRDSLRALLPGMAGAHDATYQKTAATIRSLLGTSSSDSTRLDLSSLDGRDAWSTNVRERLGEAYGDDGGLNPLVGMLQDSGTAPRPGPKWRKQIGGALEASPSSGDLLRVLLETAVEVRDELVQRVGGGTWLHCTLGQPAALQIRAAAWAAQLSEAPWAPDLLELLARRYSEPFFNGEPYSLRVANGAISGLALTPGRDSVVRLARLQRVTWHGGCASTSSESWTLSPRPRA